MEKFIAYIKELPIKVFDRLTNEEDGVKIWLFKKNVALSYDTVILDYVSLYDLWFIVKVGLNRILRTIRVKF